MSVTASQLRADVYRILDEVLDTGVPAEITRNGRTLRIVPDPPSDRLPKNKLDNVVPRPDAIIGDPDDLIHIDWSSEWRP